jgi:homoserine O-succinyltransferase
MGARSRSAPLEIGLLNNMPDAALRATEQQFSSLLKAAAGGRDVRLRLFCLPGIARGDYARSHMRGTYASAEALPAAGLDGLIVTGAEPRAPKLSQESYWGELTQVIDWAASGGPPSVWSCLAAHAAVLHLDGIERRPLAAKCSGVFDVHAAGDDALLTGLGSPGRVPHSRLNGLAEGDLAGHGYTVLTRCAGGDIDAFARRRANLMVFLQGHPEYGACSLLREYVRDVGRFLRGERPHHPAVPTGYLSPTAEKAFNALAKQAIHDPNPLRTVAYEAVAATNSPIVTWRPYAVAMCENWLGHLSTQKERRLSSFGAGATPVGVPFSRAVN